MEELDGKAYIEGTGGGLRPGKRQKGESGSC